MACGVELVRIVFARLFDQCAQQMNGQLHIEKDTESAVYKNYFMAIGRK